MKKSFKVFADADNNGRYAKVYRQYTDAILIVRVEKDGSRRTVGTSHVQAEADKTCIALARAVYNLSTGREYVTERNPKYTFDDALRVTGVR